MPRYFVFMVVAVLSATLATSVLFSQDYSPAKTFPPDGDLNDWGRLNQQYDPSYSHLYDNEAQYLDNAVNFEAGKVPPGGDPGAPGGGEEPLNHTVVDPGGIPMGSGVNMVSALVSYLPDHEGGTYWLGIDLPGPTNSNLSESFRNKFLFDNFALTRYPLPFDADCNQDRDVIDDVNNGFGSIIGNIDDHDREVYQLGLWVGGDFNQGQNYGGDSSDALADRYNGPGFPIFVVMEEHQNLGKQFTFQAYVPAKYVANSAIDLDLTSGGLNLAFHSNPATSNAFDVEVEVRGIWKQILPLIDQNELMAPVDFLDCYEAYVEFFCDSNGDESDEEKVDVGINTPPLPMVVQVVKTVLCGDCDEQAIPSFPGDKLAYALPGADTKFFLTITVPQDNPPFSSNGAGYIHGKDVITQINNYESWELCEDEITVDGQTGIIAIPDFDISDGEWVIKDAGNPTQDYLFNPIDGDIVVVIPFRVTAHSNFNTPQTGVDIRNDVEVWGNNGDVEGDHVTDFARVNILVPEITCSKEVFISDNSGGTYGPGTDLTLPNLPVSAYPLSVEWTLTLENTGETEIDLAQDAFIDNCLCLIPDLTSIQFCNGNSNAPQVLLLDGSVDVKVAWTIDDYPEYVTAVSILTSNGCGQGDQIWNRFDATGTVVTETDFGGANDIYICHTREGNDVAAMNQSCQSNAVVFTVGPPTAEIGVVKTVSCNPEAAADTKKADVLPGADVIFTMVVENTGFVDHATTEFSDDLTGAACTYAGGFQILTAGFTISPSNFQPNGDLYEIQPPLKSGESVQMIYFASTNPDYNTAGPDPECVNTLYGQADGPDPDTIPDDSDQDEAEINILVPEVSCTKTVAVITQDGSYGPAQTISNIPRTDGYPWNVTWTIVIDNSTGETYLDLDVTDLLIEGFTGNDCNLPQTLSLSPGEKKTIVCTEQIQDYADNLILDGNDVDGLDGVTHNVVEGINIQVDVDPPVGGHICYTLDGVPVAAYTPADISCDAKYNVPAPCGEIEIVDKGVSCDPGGPFDAHKEAVPGALVYFKFTVRNPSTDVDLDHAYVEDTLTGEWVDFSPINPGDFQINTFFDLGFLAAGDSIDVVYSVRADPNYNLMGPPIEIWNALEAWADGPDADDDPDSEDTECVDANKTLEKGTVNILVPSLVATKQATVEDADSNTYGPGTVIDLPDTVAYPIDVIYDIEVENKGEISFPGVDITDQVLENLTLGIPPGIGITCVPSDPPWSEVIIIGGKFEATCTVTLDNFAEATLLAKNDLFPNTDDVIENEVSAMQPTFDPDPICGPVEEVVTESNVVRIVIAGPPEEIPALDWAGIFVMIAALAGLIVWRSVHRG